MITHKIDIIPVPKPRMTQADRWKKRPCVLRYREYCDQLRGAVSRQDIFVGEKFAIEELSLTFIIPMPPSWSQRKKRELEGTAHKARPDLDNLIKAFKDALMKDDSHIHTYGTMRKIWGETGSILVHETFIPF